MHQTRRFRKADLPYISIFLVVAVILLVYQLFGLISSWMYFILTLFLVAWVLILCKKARDERREAEETETDLKFVREVKGS